MQATIASTPRAGASETRLRIIAAARAMYARKGSRGMTTREVADLAAVNEATLFRHFHTKQQLIVAMLDHYNDASEMIDVLERLPGCGTLEEQLRILAHWAIEAMRRKEDLIKISMAEEISDPEGYACVWRAPAAARALISTYFQGKVDAGEMRGDPDWLARTFMSLFFAYVMARKLWADLVNMPQDDAVASMIDVFLNGARAR